MFSGSNAFVSRPAERTETPHHGGTGRTEKDQQEKERTGDHRGLAVPRFAREENEENRNDKQPETQVLLVVSVFLVFLRHPIL